MYDNHIKEQELQTQYSKKQVTVYNNNIEVQGTRITTYQYNEQEICIIIIIIFQYKEPESTPMG